MSNIENDIAYYRALADAYNGELKRLQASVDLLRPAVDELHTYFCKHNTYKKSKKIEETMKVVFKCIWGELNDQ